MTLRRIGVLTAGGDCPGLNAAIRAVVKASAQEESLEVVGILDGYGGLVQGRTRLLGEEAVSGLLVRGGTILGTSKRDNPFRYFEEDGRGPRDASGDALKTIEKERLDGLIAIGGDGTLSGALEFYKRGVPVVGVPKTIDNDLQGTDVTFGFDTALTIATEAIDRLHSTAEAHHRVLVCEVMGHHAGWIALGAGTAGGGDVILIPEIPYEIDVICDAIGNRHKRGKNFSLVVVAEGAKPAGGAAIGCPNGKGYSDAVRLGGVGQLIAKAIEDKMQLETRVVVLGHVQRGGTPTALDRWLATRYGVHAIELVKRHGWGRMVSLKGSRIQSVALEDAVHELKRVDPRGDLVRTTRAVGTCFGSHAMEEVHAA